MKMEEGMRTMMRPGMGMVESCAIFGGIETEVSAGSGKALR
jgi:hypothetical protein